MQLYFRYLYLDARALKLLTRVLPSLQENSEDVSISIDTIVTMVMSHSSFLTVMFNEESPESKGLYSKTCVKWPLSKRPKIGFQDHLSINAGQKYSLEHSAILSTFMLPIVINP